jgi:signal transduction histidine kinase
LGTLVITRDTTVVAESGLSGARLGRALAEQEDLDPELRTAIRQAASAAGPTSLEVGRDAGAVGVIVADAIPLRRAPCDLERLLSSALEPLRGQARAADVDVRVHAEGLPRELGVDPEKLAWAVTVLVGNALRHVRHGSRILPGGSVEVRLRQQDGDVLVVVEDDGSGIPADRLPGLFRRDPGRPHAVGLALTLVQDVVAAHGGTIDVASSTGASDHGTRITLRLPVR